MKFVMEFDCDNAAFEEGMATEIARILRRVATSVEHGNLPDTGDVSSIRDINGNRIGEWGIQED